MVIVNCNLSFEGCGCTFWSCSSYFVILFSVTSKPNTCAAYNNLPRHQNWRVSRTPVLLPTICHVIQIVRTPIGLSKTRGQPGLDLSVSVFPRTRYVIHTALQGLVHLCHVLVLCEVRTELYVKPTPMVQRHSHSFASCERVLCVISELG